MTTIQFVSDLHLEFYKPDEYNFNDFVIPKSEIIALLGDIGNPGKELYQRFLKDCSENFKLVLVISGNHEYYTNNFFTTMNKVDDLIQSLCNKYANVKYLNNTKYTHQTNDETIVFLGTTLWSKIIDREKKVVKEVSGDLLNIFTKDKTYLTIEEVNNLHSKNVLWLETELENNKNSDTQNKIIVLTHHLPSYKAIAPKYRAFKYNSMFANDLDNIIQKYSMFAWLFGHTHSQVNLKIGNTVIKANPRGYLQYDNSHENKLYNKELVLSLT